MLKLSLLGDELLLLAIFSRNFDLLDCSSRIHLALRVHGAVSFLRVDFFDDFLTEIAARFTDIPDIVSKRLCNHL